MANGTLRLDVEGLDQSREDAIEALLAGLVKPSPEIPQRTVDLDRLAQPQLLGALELVKAKSGVRLDLLLAADEPLSDLEMQDRNRFITASAEDRIVEAVGHLFSLVAAKGRGDLEPLVDALFPFALRAALGRRIAYRIHIASLRQLE